MPDPTGPIAQQLAALRRGQILDAAATVFAERGFHRATVRDVARAAGVADGTIYLYFPSKTALLLGLLDRLNESAEREARFALGTRDDFRTFFVGYLRERFALLGSNAELLRAVLPETLANSEVRRVYHDRIVAPTLAIAERYFEFEAARGRLRPLDVPLTVRALAALPLGLIVLQFLGDDEIERRWSELPDAIADLILDGLGTPDQNGSWLNAATDVPGNGGGQAAALPDGPYPGSAGARRPPVPPPDDARRRTGRRATESPSPGSAGARRPPVPADPPPDDGRRRISRRATESPSSGSAGARRPPVPAGEVNVTPDRAFGGTE